jgi:hypothetical protein
MVTRISACLNLCYLKTQSSSKLIQMCMEHWWNDTDRGKQNKYHKGWPEIETKLPRWNPSDQTLWDMARPRTPFVLLMVTKVRSYPAKAQIGTFSGELSCQKCVLYLLLNQMCRTKIILHIQLIVLNLNSLMISDEENILGTSSLVTFPHFLLTSSLISNFLNIQFFKSWFKSIFQTYLNTRCARSSVFVIKVDLGMN